MLIILQKHFRIFFKNIKQKTSKIRFLIVFLKTKSGFFFYNCKYLWANKFSFLKHRNFFSQTVSKFDEIKKYLLKQKTKKIYFLFLNIFIRF